jgi:endonuclease/exonuclease/phosphatase family metal-dependent hydrolase
MTRRRCWGWLGVLAVSGLWVLSASRPGLRVNGCPTGCTPLADSTHTAPQQQPAQTLKVMSLNMLHGFRRFEHLSDRLDLITAEIKKQEADIVCLQEVPWTLRLGNGARLLAERTGMNHVYLRANGSRWAILFEEGEAILSRYPLLNLSHVELRPRPGFFEHRVVLKATVATPSGDVDVFVSHLTNGDADINRSQAEALMEFVESSGQRPAIVAGDLNAMEDTPQIQAMSERWVDSYRAANPDDAGYTCCVSDLSSDPSEPLEKRIDYLFLVSEEEGSVRVQASQRVFGQPSPVAWGWQWASDHVGIMTTLHTEVLD